MTTHFFKKIYLQYLFSKCVKLGTKLIYLYNLRNVKNVSKYGSDFRICAVNIVALKFIDIFENLNADRWNITCCFMADCQ